MRQPFTQALVAASGVTVCIAAFLRGNYLFGLTCAFIYVAAALGLLWLLARSRTIVQAAAVGVLSLAIAFTMGWPASINPDVQHSIDQQATDRAARAELAAVFASDPTYRGLAISTVRRKVVNVTVSGSLDTWADFDRLQARIVAECSTMEQCVIHWDVTLRDPVGRVQGINSELFGPG